MDHNWRRSPVRISGAVWQRVAPLVAGPRTTVALAGALRQHAVEVDRLPAWAEGDVQEGSRILHTPAGLVLQIEAVWVVSTDTPARAVFVAVRAAAWKTADAARRSLTFTDVAQARWEAVCADLDAEDELDFVGLADLPPQWSSVSHRDGCQYLDNEEVAFVIGVGEDGHALVVDVLRRGQDAGDLDALLRAVPARELDVSSDVKQELQRRGFKNWSALARSLWWEVTTAENGWTLRAEHPELGAVQARVERRDAHLRGRRTRHPFLICVLS